jgi:hypothetical protein
MSAEKKFLKKNDPPSSPGTREYVESVLRRKKSTPYKPFERKKHVESILGTCKNMTIKSIQFENTIPHSVRLVNPIINFVELNEHYDGMNFGVFIRTPKMGEAICHRSEIIY